MQENLLEEAIRFATHAHSGMVRKVSCQPYILHPLEAAVIVGSMTNDPEILAAAVLHDVVEDTPVTMDQLVEKFGPRVTELVASETEDKQFHREASESWEERKSEAVEFLKTNQDIGVKMLYLGDKLSNLRSIHRDLRAMGDGFWDLFNQKDSEKHHWYYRSIADAISELSEYAAWQEFDRLIHDVFQEE